MALRAREDLLSTAAGLPIGPCAACEREVLAYAAAEVGAGEGYACVHCDRPIHRVEWIDEGELARLGYDLRDPLAGPGCASGCARGGCARPAPSA